MQKTEISKPEVILSLILDHDPYPKYKHQQRTKQAAENKPISLKLSKCFNQKIKPKMLKSIFHNQEAKLNIHQVKKNKESLKKLWHQLSQKLDWCFTLNRTQIKKTEKHSLNRFNFDSN